MKSKQTVIINRIFCLNCLVIAVLVVLNIFLSAQVAQDGLQIDTLSKKQDTIKKEISYLEQELVTKTSLVDLSVKAQELGYEKPQTVVSISSSIPVAAAR